VFITSPYFNNKINECTKTKTKTKMNALTTISQLKSFPYVNLKGETIKNPRIKADEVLQMFAWLLTKQESYSIDVRLLRAVFTDKASQFMSILKSSGAILELSPARHIVIGKENGGTEYYTIPAKYGTSFLQLEGNIEDNSYYKRFVDKVKNNKNFNKYQDILDILDNVTNTLSSSTIDGESISTEIKYKKGRFYSNYTSFSKEKRQNIKIDNTSTISFDIKSSVIQLLTKNIIAGIEGQQELIDIINNGGDVYEFFAKKVGKTRDEVKKDVIKQIFMHPSQMSADYLNIEFFKSVQKFKYDNGYKTIYKIYSFLERKLMIDIYNSMIMNNIKFLPMHDAIIVKSTDKEKVNSIIKDTTSIIFTIEEKKNKLWEKCNFSFLNDFELI
jgi:hypothetical protein